MARHQITLNIEAPDGLTPGPEHLFAALEAALDEASQDPSELMRRIQPSDPSRDWTVRSDSFPGLILTDHLTDTWYACTPDAVPDTALHGPDAGPSFSLGAGRIWCRRDLISGEAVFAQLHSDDRVIDLKVDIRPFLETATADDVNELIADDWSYAESADRVAYALEGAGDPGAGRLFWYLGLNPGGTGNAQVGFGLSADGEAALAWIAEHRPDLHASLDFEDGPDGP